MPRIPVVTAGGETAAVLVQPSATIAVTGYQGLATFGNITGQFGEQLQKIGETLQARQNELDTLKMIGDFNGRVKQLQYDVRTSVPNPLDRAKEFEKAAKEMQDELVSGAKNPNVAREFSQYAARHLPLHTGQVHIDAMENLGQTQTAQRRDIQDGLSRSAYREADDPNTSDAVVIARRDAWIKTGIGLINSDPHVKPLEQQAERKKFVEQTQREFMDHLARTDYDRLQRFEAAGAFKDVDQKTHDSILDRAENKRARQLTQTNAEMRRLEQVAREGIEIEAVRRSNTGTMTQEWIDENSSLMAGATNGAEKVQTWQNILRDQQLGIKRGNPEIERQFEIDVYNENLNPQTTLDRLNRLYNQRVIGKDRYDLWAPHLQTTISRKNNEARALQNEGEAKVTSIRRRRADTVLQTAADALKVTGIVDFDKEATDALTEFRQIFVNEEVSHGGGKDAQQVYNEHMPATIAKVEQRFATRVVALEDALGQYKTKEQLIADKSKLSPVEYERKLVQMYDLYQLRIAKQKLEMNRKAIQRTPTPTTR